MSKQNLAQAAIKSLFEQKGTRIKDFGIEPSFLKTTMTKLVGSYCEEQEFDLAVSAATVSEDDENFRTILAAMKSGVAVPKSGRWIDVMMKVSCERSLLKTVLLRVGSKEELREFVDIKGLWTTDRIDVLRHLEDSEALLQIGRQQLDDYFRICEEEKAKGSYSSGTSSIPGEAIKFLDAALVMGHPKASAELIQFGDRLREKNGVGEEYYGGSLFSGQDVDPVIKAYLLSNCREGYLKAAQCHQEIGERNLQEAQRQEYGLEELATAAQLFVKAEDFTSLRGIVNTFIESGDLLRAVRALHLSGEQITAAALERLMDSTSEISTEAVKAAILKYLEDHDREIPFYTECTYWHFSDSNSEWRGCNLGIERLAGRFDLHSLARRETVAISKQLYSTDKAEAIGAIHNRLRHHLIVGWMLSGVARDIKHGAPTRDRKYSFSTYAAYRSFSYAFDAGGYNPFDGDVGLKDYGDIHSVSEYLDGIIEEWDKLLHEGRNTWKSNDFLNGKLHEMRDRLKTVFDAVTADIRRQVEAL